MGRDFPKAQQRVVLTSEPSWAQFFYFQPLHFARHPAVTECSNEVPMRPRPGSTWLTQYSRIWQWPGMEATGTGHPGPEQSLHSVWFFPFFFQMWIHMFPKEDFTRETQAATPRIAGRTSHASLGDPEHSRRQPPRRSPRLHGCWRVSGRKGAVNRGHEDWFGNSPEEEKTSEPSLCRQQESLQLPEKPLWRSCLQLKSLVAS